MRAANVRFGFLLAIAAATLAVSAWLASRGLLTVDAIRGLVAQGGLWSPLLYLVLAAILPIGWVPRLVTTAVAGALFGFPLGCVLGLVGGVAGGMLGYAIGFQLGHPWVEAHAGPRGRKVLSFVARRGFAAIVLGRICPAMSCELISLGSGIAAIPMRTFVPATVVGMFPGSILYAALGASIVEETHAVTLASVVVFGVLSLVTGIWIWRLWKLDEQVAV